MKILKLINRWFAMNVFCFVPNMYAFNFFIALPGFVMNHGRLPRSINSLDATLNDFWFQRMIDPDHGAKINRFIDKERMKDLISRIFPELKIAKTISVIHEIDRFDLQSFHFIISRFLGRDYIAKPTHSSGVITSLYDFGHSDLKRLHDASKRNYFHSTTRETQYDKLQRNVIIEERLKHDGNDYKFFCSYGRILFAFIYYKDGTRQLVESEGCWVSTGSKKHPSRQGKVKLPKNWLKMYSTASQMSKDFEFVRVDLYNVRGRVGFGELTFTPGGSFVKFGSEEFSKYFLNKIKMYSQI